MKTYSKMKESGIEWIGKIPENWELRKVKNSELMKISSGEVTENYEEGEFSVYGANGKIGKSDLYNVENIVMIGRVGYYAGSVIQIPEKAWVTDNGLIVKTSSEIDNGFLFYAFSSLDFNRFAQITAQPLISQTLLSQFQFCLPSTKEQSNIANYLDKQTKIIDIKIEKNQKLIILLEKKKQSLINQVVTKGLDSSVQMKDSGVEWIGKIPEHWNVRKFKTIGKLNSGGTPSTQVKEYWNNGTIPWLSSGEINNNNIESSNEKITELGLRESTARLFPKGSVLLAITGQGKTRGRTSLLKIDSSSNQSVVGIAIDHSKIFNYFLWYYLQSQYWNLRSLSQGSVQSGLNLHILKNYYIPSNSLIEQKEIVDYIDEHTLKINLVIKNIQSQIKKLQEFTQSLTSSAVTGKIDVRGIII